MAPRPRLHPRPGPQPQPLLDGAGIFGAMRVVFADYEDLLGGFPDIDADVLKAFANRHVASRTALAHIEHLAKLATASGDTTQQHEIAALRDAARRSMAATEEGPGDVANAIDAA